MSNNNEVLHALARYVAERNPFSVLYICSDSLTLEGVYRTFCVLEHTLISVMTCCRP